MGVRHTFQARDLAGSRESPKSQASAQKLGTQTSLALPSILTRSRVPYSSSLISLTTLNLGVRAVPEYVMALFQVLQ